MVILNNVFNSTCCFKPLQSWFKSAILLSGSLQIALFYNSKYILKCLLLSREKSLMNMCVWGTSLEGTDLRARRWLWRFRPLRFVCPFFSWLFGTVSFVFTFSSSSLGARLVAVSNLEEKNINNSLASNISQSTGC